MNSQKHYFQVKLEVFFDESFTPENYLSIVKKLNEDIYEKYLISADLQDFLLDKHYPRDGKKAELFIETKIINNHIQVNIIKEKNIPFSWLDDKGFGWIDETKLSMDKSEYSDYDNELNTYDYITYEDDDIEVCKRIYHEDLHRPIEYDIKIKDETLWKKFKLYDSETETWYET
ncbi:hypothetical protein [Wielerella bovis]|uniref:hypothetical protein n=1 Tax=Wielerella bovis TaxID=2917790 RepID=UPI002018F33F|nr:hypothetical protein [Wielerella bovis]ULJ59903.1 hypothetical protein MIS44_09530 [Wielerella bovis]